jgi:uncharacterized protein (DUF433 family)
MTNTQRLLYLNRKKLVIKDIEYIIDSKSQEEHSNAEKSTIPDHLSSSLKWSKNSKQNTFTHGANPTEFFQAIKNSNRELEEMEEHIEMILVAANNDRNILEECENYLQQKYKVYLAKNLHVTFSSIHEYCLELLKNAKIRSSMVISIPSSLVGEASPLENRITINPNKMNGQPCIRDLRLTVWRVIELIQTYPDRSELYREFPELTEEDINQAIVYADLHSPESSKEPIITNPIAHETFA